MTVAIIPFAAGEFRLDWLELTAALKSGHAREPAKTTDTFLYRGTDTLLSRSAWIEGLGIAVKTATVFPGNAAGTPTINGAVTLFDDRTGQLDAVIDFHLVTKWKTAADSLLGALQLARPDSAEILIVGSGAVAASLVEAYSAGFPAARIAIWSRSAENARVLASRYPDTRAVADLPAATTHADIIACATMAIRPVIRGAWLRPGQHLDLIGAYRPDMREADDDALARARLFVDNRATVLDHIGEFRIPIDAGVIRRDDVVADFYDLPSGRMTRLSDDEITLFKNGGGAHLDLMTGRYILSKWDGGDPPS